MRAAAARLASCADLVMISTFKVLVRTGNRCALLMLPEVESASAMQLDRRECHDVLDPSISVCCGGVPVDLNILTDDCFYSQSDRVGKAGGKRSQVDRG